MVAKRTGPAGGFKLFFCADHEPRPSHLSSGREQEALEIVESVEDDLAGLADNPDDALARVDETLASAAEMIETLREEIEEGAANIEDGMGHATAQSEAMEETAYALEEWGDKFTSYAEELPEALDEDEFTLEGIVETVHGLLAEIPDIEVSGS